VATLFRDAVSLAVVGAAMEQNAEERGLPNIMPRAF